MYSNNQNSDDEAIFDVIILMRIFLLPLVLSCFSLENVLAIIAQRNIPNFHGLALSMATVFLILEFTVGITPTCYFIIKKSIGCNNEY